MVTQPVSFKPLPVSSTSAPWCVDGRPASTQRGEPDPKAAKGPQMLGGSLHPLVLSAVFMDRDFNEQLVTESTKTLTANGYKLGVHRGSHRKIDAGKSDCGFADALKNIFQTIDSKKEEIAKRLAVAYQQNAATFAKYGVDEPTFDALLADTLDKLGSYTPERLKITGEELVAKIESLGASVVNLQGDHAEKRAFVSIKPGETYDTNAQAAADSQAFNLDLLVAVEQAKTLGVEQGFTILASLILYLATEMVLVEDKGKPALDVVIYQ